ncbi:hypothetical protein CRENBAI_010554 [Crenichthys baileyi]|uniref:Uncharacterized protein n=1 Tax=Crenichthys baileyi TaxID=28760 RepID=A0AAV9SLX6_9TELE
MQTPPTPLPQTEPGLASGTGIQTRNQNQNPLMHQRPPGRCRMPEHAPAQNPGDIPDWTQSPPGPARTPAWGRHFPGTQSPQAHPRSAQEQPGHHASNLCMPVQAPQKHRMQPPDDAPESHQSPTLVGAPAPGARPPRDPSPGTPQRPQTQKPPRIRWAVLAIVRLPGMYDGICKAINTQTEMLRELNRRLDVILTQDRRQVAVRGLRGEMG